MEDEQGMCLFLTPMHGLWAGYSLEVLHGVGDTIL
jgi:hypothetical protein